jgi:hypothetical protein
VNNNCEFDGCNATNCPAGYECVHNGCFQITTASCANCPTNCGGKCFGSVDGSGNYLCGQFFPCSPFEGNCPNFCNSNADCGDGLACVQDETNACISTVCLAPSS